MSSAAAQAASFYRDVAATGRVWTVRDADGCPAPEVSPGVRAQPFRSTRSRAERIIRKVPAYQGFSPEEMSWEEFRDVRLVGLRRDRMLVGVNWSGAKAAGYDLEPDWVQHCVEVAIENLGGPPATPIEQVVSPTGLVVGYRLVR